VEPVAIVRRRLAAQRLTGEPFATPAEAVRWLGAVQAQEFAEAKWSVALRTRACTDADVETAFARGEILRTHLLRPTWHFVAPADLRWMLALTAPRVHGANRYMYRKLGLGEDELARSLELVAEALAPGEPRTRAELAGALRAAGLEAEGMRLGYLLMHAELEALIVSGPRRGRQHTYVLLEQRCPEAAPLPREEALAALARRFFTSRGPATVHDFATWSGLTVTDARAGVALAGDALARETEWISAPDGGDDPAGGAFLIPMYDELIMGYKDLKVVLAAPPPRAGLLERAIVIDGLTVGSWRRTLSAREVRVEATVFRPLEPDESAALEAAVQRFGRCLGRAAQLRSST